MSTEKREVFVADDGKVFETMDACVAHEKQIAEIARRIERLKVFTVSSSFDSTEGRGYHQTTYIVTDADLAVVIEYCLDRFGKPLSGWYGDGFYEAWRLHTSDMSAADALRRVREPHGGIGTTRGAADLVFLSQTNLDHPDLPKRVFHWPKKPGGKA